MPPDPAEFNARVIEEFRANQGRVASVPGDMPILLLQHVGAKSGVRRVNPVAYLLDNGRYVVFASNMAAPSHPGWYHNLIAGPHVMIEVGGASIDVVASEAISEERDRLYKTMSERLSFFADYEQQTERTIPVVVLTPVPIR